MIKKSNHLYFCFLEFCPDPIKLEETQGRDKEKRERKRERERERNIDVISQPNATTSLSLEKNKRIDNN